MTAFEQYFLVMVSMMLYKVVPTLESVDEIQSVTNQMNAIEEKLIFLWHYSIMETGILNFGTQECKS